MILAVVRFNFLSQTLDVKVDQQYSTPGAIADCQGGLGPERSAFTPLTSADSQHSLRATVHGHPVRTVTQCTTQPPLQATQK
jgi:hypothetical protein